MPEQMVVPTDTPRNAPCPCGSGKRYKHCHGAPSAAPPPRPAAAGEAARAAPPPDQVQAVLALVGQGRLAEGLERAEALAEHYPHAPLLANIAGILKTRLGRPEAAVADFSRALALAPGFFEAHSNLGNALRALGRLDEAVASYTRALRLRPGNSDTHNNLGNAYKALGRQAEALESYSSAIRADPGNAMAHYNRARLLAALGDAEPAIASYSQAIALKRDLSEAHNGLGRVLRSLECHEEAIASYRRALEIKPDYAAAQNNLGAVLRLNGRTEEAEEACRRALALEPDLVEAHHNLALSHHFEPGDPLIGLLEQQLSRHPEDGRDRMHLLEALGKAHLDIGSHAEAFGFYRQANAQAARQASFDPVAQPAEIAAMKAAFPQPLLCQDASPDSATPVFVVGMSRSGKTCVESLLAQHPAVVAAGEARTWWQALDRLRETTGSGLAFPAFVKSMPPELIRQLGRRYLDDLRNLRRLAGISAPQGGLYVNTLPNHYLHLGLIFRAFPSVKVIYCRRDPLDQCLAIYFTIYAEGNAYSYDLASLAAYYRNYRDMMEHWLRLYGERILVVDYEDLVREPAEMARRIFTHCGLDLPEAPLRADFHTREIGHAANFDRQLAPLRAALQDTGAAPR